MEVTASQFDMLARFLDAASLRHKVLAHNVANANTPGYRRLELSFDLALAQHQRVAPRVVEDADGPTRADGNNVDMDKEMGRVTKNALLYNTFAQILAGQVATMRSAITGR